MSDVALALDLVAGSDPEDAVTTDASPTVTGTPASGEPLPRSTTLTVSSRVCPSVGWALAPDGTGPVVPQAASVAAAIMRTAVSRDAARGRARVLGAWTGGVPK